MTDRQEVIQMLVEFFADCEKNRQPSFFIDLDAALRERGMSIEATQRGVFGTTIAVVANT